jgi:hypothetical protein
MGTENVQVFFLSQAAAGASKGYHGRVGQTDQTHRQREPEEARGKTSTEQGESSDT